MRAGIYILRPPEHGQLHLANAQAKWLSGKGASRGWYRLLSEATAQEAADDGRFVVASYDSGRESVAGHIAVVRPRQSGSGALAGPGGPEIAQAGLHNFARGNLDRGFGTRRWSVRYYGCNLP